MTSDENYLGDVLAQIERATRDPAGGVTRESYGQGENTARMIVADCAQDAGLVVDWDNADNMLIRLPGVDYSRGRITCGSHLDSVPCGGNYDGAAGVVAGLALLRRLRDTRASGNPPVETVAFRGEESAWYGLCYIGSRAALGLLKDADLDRRTAAGKTLREAMSGRASVSWIAEGRRLWDTLPSSYWEVHIEQGPVLAAVDAPIGVVTGIRGNVRHEGRCTGEAGHSGTTPHHLRRDPVVAFSRFVSEVQEQWEDMHLRSGRDLVVTFGRMATDQHAAVSRIASHVEFTLEWRSLDPGTLADFGAFVARAIEANRRAPIRLGPATSTRPVQLDPALVERTLSCCRRRGIPAPVLPSGAGHDAAVMAGAGVPSAMIFVRNRNGSHNPDEAMDPADLALAVDVLEDAIMTSAVTP